MGGGAASPTGSVRPGTGGSYKRKRSGIEFESSPGTGGEGEEDDQDRRRQPGVKRACNECRQQKVSQSAAKTTRECDLVTADHHNAIVLYGTNVSDL